MYYQGVVRRRRRVRRRAYSGHYVEVSEFAETVYWGPWRGSRAEAADDAVGYLRRRYGVDVAETRLEGGCVRPICIDPIVGGQYWPEVKEKVEPSDIGQMYFLGDAGGDA